MEAKCSVCEDNWKSEENPVIFECHSKIFCGKCVGKHVGKEINAGHVIRKVNEELSGCWYCGANIAMVCECKGLKKRFCRYCFAAHLEIEKASSHVSEAVVEPKDIQPEFQILLDRARKVESLKAKIKENVKRAEGFCRGLDSEVEVVRGAVEEHFREIETQVEEVERVLEGVSEELEACKNDPEASELAIMQRLNFQNPKGKALKLFDSEIDLIPSLSALRNFATISIVSRSIKPDSKLYLFKPRTKELQIIDTLTWTTVKKPFPKSLKIKDSGAWCDLPNRQIFHCGGVSGPNFAAEACIIDSNTLSVLQLANMNQSRALMATIYYNNSIYVFGGYSGKNLNLCERFEMKKEKWTVISAMPVPRSAFNVVEYQGCLYMTGDNKNIDKYNPINDSYETFENILPENSAYSTLACFEGVLYLMQNNKCWEIDLQRLQVITSTSIPSGKWWSFFPARVIGEDIIISRYDEACVWSFSMKNKLMIKK